jgi:uncharacterized protein (DUF1330 family)
MVAYFIAEIDVHDQETYDKYRQISGRTIQEHGGRFVVRGGKVEAAEGGWNPSRFVVVEFPTLERAKAWYNSPEYGEGLKLRHAAAKSRAFFVEGPPPA